MNGLSVMRAGDGLSALRAVEQYQPDLVLLDLMLPHIDGWTVLKEFAARDSTRNIPVVVVTAVDPTPKLPHAKAVIGKPCDADHLVRVVTRHLESGAAFA
jgi:CheY-like chemotaxis protein